MDSGTSVSVINATTYKSLNSPKLVKSNRILHPVGQNPIQILGELHTVAKYGNHEANIVLIVADVKSSSNLFGLDLFKLFNYEIQQIANVNEQHNEQITALCGKYKEVFDPVIGIIKYFQARVYLKPNATRTFYKSRQIPFAQMANFKGEADRLIQIGRYLKTN